MANCNRGGREQSHSAAAVSVSPWPIYCGVGTAPPHNVLTVLEGRGKPVPASKIIPTHFDISLRNFQHQKVMSHQVYQMKLKIPFLKLLSKLSQFILLGTLDDNGTHSLSGQNWLWFRGARGAAWQRSALPCVDFVYSQGWSKGTDGKKIGLKEGTDAPAWGAR